MKSVFKVMTNCVMLAAVVAFAAMSVTGCKSSKPASVMEGSKEISVPFSGREYRSDKDFFRASNSYLSRDLSMAKRGALLAARQELAASVEVVIKAVTESYAQERQIADKDEFSQKVEGMTREVVKQTLNDVRVMDEKFFKEADGRFRCFVAIEMSKEPVVRGLSQGISKEAKLQQDFDQHRFRQILEAEMSKLD